MAKAKKEPEVTEEENAEVEVEAKTEAKEEATKEVVFNKNVKYGDTPIEAGVKTHIKESDYDELVAEGHIDEE